jgi:hypothetical protein
MYKMIKNGVSLSMILCIIISCQAIAQIPVEAELTYNKLADNTITLSATISDTEEYDPVSNLDIEFISRIDTTKLSLGKATTNEEGLAILKGVPFSRLLLNDAHQFFLSFVVPNPKDYVEKAKEIAFQEVGLKIDFKEIDSIKQIVVTVASWDEEGNVIAIEEAEAYLYVPRLFSLLPIGYIYTEEGGIGMKKFPTDLPGGVNGEMTIVAQLEDHEKYGNVAIDNSINWGLVNSVESTGKQRELWSPEAPLWMLITFIILMVGVWFHYGWIVFNMFKINSLKDDGEVIYE